MGGPVIACFDNAHWAVGTLNKALIARVGGVMLDWNTSHAPGMMQRLSETHVFLTSGPGLWALHTMYKVPLDRIHVMTHDEDDLAALRTAFGAALPDVLDQLHGYAVPSAHLVSSVLGHGVRRVPQVVPYGIELSRWTFRARTQLNVLGMAGAKARQSNTGHADCKRGYLADEVSAATGVPLQVTNGGVSDVNAWMQGVDGVLVAGVFEGGPLSPFEAAACGVPTFGAEIGSWLTLGRQAGIILPVAAPQYVQRAVQWVRYYRDNPTAYAELSHRVHEVAQQYDWDRVVPWWVDWLTNPVREVLPYAR
jgi:hypothetical protein